jgi:Nuclease-related domain
VAGSRSLKLRRADTCVSCGAALAAGTVAYWDAEARTVTCLTCRGETTSVSEGRVPEVVPVAPQELDRGTAGASARRRYERLHEQRQQAARDQLGKRLGGLYLSLSSEPQTTVAWAQGARGERLLGEYLEKLHDDETVVVLHDRRIPGSRANVDHIAVTRSGGVWSIDAKNYTGKVQRIDKGGWFTADERLYVGRRDCSKLVAGMAKQVEAIKHALGEPVMQEFAVTVKAALCFVDAEWSLFEKPFALEGVWIGWAKALGTRLQAEGALAPEHLRLLARRVAEALPPA